MIKKSIPLTFIFILAAAGIGFLTGTAARPSNGPSESAAPPPMEGSSVAQAVLTSTPTPSLQADGDVILFDFEDPIDVARFVYGNVNAFVEPAEEVVLDGKYS